MATSYNRPVAKPVATRARAGALADAEAAIAERATGWQQLGGMEGVQQGLGNLEWAALDSPIGLRTQYNRLNDFGNWLSGLGGGGGTAGTDSLFEGVPAFDPSTGFPTRVVDETRAIDLEPPPQRVDSGIGERGTRGARDYDRDRGRVPGQPRAATAAEEDVYFEAKKQQQNAVAFQGIMADAQLRIDELNRLQLEAIQEGANEVAAQYDEQIAKLQDRLSKAKVGMQMSMEAFRHYSAQVSPAFVASVEAAQAGEQAREEAMAGRVDGAISAMESGYAQNVETVEEVADLIDMGNLQIGPSLASAVRQFESIFEDAARQNIGEIDRIAEAGAKFATATAKAAWAQDEFMTENDRRSTELKIQAQIDALVENIAETEAAKKKAYEAAMSEYDPLLGFETTDEAWQYLIETYANEKGWAPGQLEQVLDDMAKMGAAGVSNRAEARAWVKSQLAPLNADAIAEYLVGLKGGTLNAAEAAAVKAIASNRDGVPGAAGIAKIAQSLGIDLTDEVLDGLMYSEADYADVIEAWDMYDNLVTNWEDIRAVDPGPKGTTAPANYANRNNPAYVSRRTVGVPTFVNSFLERFGKSGTGRNYVGGVTSSYQGALRGPNMTGNGRAVNSDHLSGGAVDLYGDTLAELKAIEAWAKSQPGVSYVIYSGNPNHETGVAGGANSGNNGRGHVHVSLRLGYW